ncbi:MAG: hypothetical protein PHN74_02440 [Candidatus Pacebacteria bacterium]|nr:hypothetical protein [Candidatus Paceibacterota bacterium]
MAQEKKEIKWTALEYEYYEKSVSWYWISGIIAAVIALIAIRQKNFLFAIFVAMAELVLISWAKRVPKNLEFAINDEGVVIGSIKFLPYGGLSEFCLRERAGDFGELILKSKSKLQGYTKISIFNKDIPEIEKFLSEKLREFEYEETIIDTLSKIIKF